MPRVGNMRSLAGRCSCGFFAAFGGGLRGFFHGGCGAFFRRVAVLSSGGLRCHLQEGCGAIFRRHFEREFPISYVMDRRKMDPKFAQNVDIFWLKMWRFLHSFLTFFVPRIGVILSSKCDSRKSRGDASVAVRNGAARVASSLQEHRDGGAACGWFKWSHRTPAATCSRAPWVGTESGLANHETFLIQMELGRAVVCARWLEMASGCQEVWQQVSSFLCRKFVTQGLRLPAVATSANESPKSRRAPGNLQNSVVGSFAVACGRLRSVVVACRHRIRGARPSSLLYSDGTWSRGRLMSLAHAG